MQDEKIINTFLLTDRIVAWKRLQEAATPGEWRVHETSGSIFVNGPQDTVDLDEFTRNSHLTVASIAIVPDLIAEIERQRVQLQMLGALVVQRR